MTKLKYKISREALFDLNDIWQYTFHKWSQNQADRYYNLIFEEIEFISKNSHLGISYAHIRKNYRTSKVKSHLIFYRTNDDGIIEVIRVLHQRMDLKNKLKQ
jgi:toxin ParE1/3/4